MPLTADSRRIISQIRDYLWGGGYPDPMQNAEQLAFLFFFYLFEGADEATGPRRPPAGRRALHSVFAGEWTLRNPLNAPRRGRRPSRRELLRWSSWANALTGERLVILVRDEVFPFYAEVARNGTTNFMDGARLAIDEPTVLSQVVTLVNELRLETPTPTPRATSSNTSCARSSRRASWASSERRATSSARSSRWSTRSIGETVYDPAAGTAGFLVAAYDHIRLANSSPSVEEVEMDGKPLRRGHGERLLRGQSGALHDATFYGNDVDAAMVRLATMNLTLRGLAKVRILRRNVLTTTLDAAAKAELGLPLEGYDVVLANPPFSGQARQRPHRR